MPLQLYAQASGRWDPVAQGGGGGPPPPPPLAFVTKTLPNGTVGTAQSNLVSVQGGTAPYVFTKTGSLPTGETLDAPSGLVAGTPSGAGSFTFSIIVTDASGQTVTQSFTVIITAAATLTITTTAFQDGNVGNFYSDKVNVVGGTPPITLSESGPIPAGLTFDATGVMSGTPTAQVTDNPTITARDSLGATDTQVCPIKINAAVANSGVIFGCAPGTGWPYPGKGNGNAAQTPFEVINAHVGTPNKELLIRATTGPGSGPGGFPNAWNDGHTGNIANCPSGTIFYADWERFDIDGLLAGKYDAGIKTFALSCQNQWLHGGSGFAPKHYAVSFWHEADHGGGGPPTPAQVLQLHAYYYPRFKQWAPNVSYGQNLTRDQLVAAPNSWLSCPATVDGKFGALKGSVLDHYAIDGYDHGRTAATVYVAAFAAIRKLVPNAKIGIAEHMTVVGSAETRPQWCTDVWNLAVSNNLIFANVFFQGIDNTQNITWLTGDSATISALQKITAKSAPSGTTF